MANKPQDRFEVESILNVGYTTGRSFAVAKLGDLLIKAGAYLPDGKVQLVEAAYDFAAAKHEGQTRLTGEPYIQHPLQTAFLLADLHQDATALAAALLHDVMEDCDVPREELKARFGEDVARLVDGVTKLAHFDILGQRSTDESSKRAEDLRKMLLAMAEDIRVVLIKLADRLHNMKTLDAHPPERRRQIAMETLDIYAPLAHRLGISELQAQLEDLALRHAEPEVFASITRLLSRGKKARERYLTQQEQVLLLALQNSGIDADVTGRPKSIHSIYQKMRKYAELGKDFGEIYDLYALRVIVTSHADCYNALGIVHNLWHPIPGQFDDYVAMPKENLYQSLHTAVMCEGGTPLEIQIRTKEMHQLSEYGVAAHWAYKEGSPLDTMLTQRMSWLRQLLEWQREVSGAEEFLESVRTDIFQDQVFVYTPKGDIRELPTGATSIDFAYRIHTDLGHRCIGAKVNGRLVALDTQLANGDTVEIVTSKRSRGPSLDWLNPSLGFTQTTSARQSIRQWFRKQNRSANINQGREALKKIMRRLGISNVTDKDLAETLNYTSTNALLAAIGAGTLTSAQLETRLNSEEATPLTTAQRDIPLDRRGPTGVHVLGVGDLLTRTAACCNPLPGDQIIGYITRNSGVNVHRTDCTNVVREDEQGRLINVNWGLSQHYYPVRVVISGIDRVGLLRDVSTLVSAEKVNMGDVSSEESDNGTAIITLTLYTTSTAQLSRLFLKLEGVRGVLTVARVRS
jgi:guanosine-3',5'-bis(diphosphate) 3'-pyrophosphohydrolase